MIKSKSVEQGGAQPAVPPDVNDAWVEDRLRALYESVLNEPLPDDMVDLVGRKRTK